MRSLVLTLFLTGVALPTFAANLAPATDDAAMRAAAANKELPAASTATGAPVLQPLPAAEPAPVKPRVFFVNLKDGDTVKNPVLVKFGLEGMKVAPAGDFTPQTGHFHLLVDSAISEEDMEFAIPADDNHIHYGKGQTEATLTLPPGPHKLQILLGDGGHVPHKPPVMSETITVNVQ